MNPSAQTSIFDADTAATLGAMRLLAERPELLRSTIARLRQEAHPASASDPAM